MLEVYTYERGYLKGYTLTPNQIDSRQSSEKGADDTDSRERSLKRAKQTLRRLINANVGQYGREFTAKFMTLTFEEKIVDVKKANYEFTKFMQRLNYRVYGVRRANLKYTTVIEFDKNGRIHYHVIIYNMPFVKANEIANVWDNGFIKINKIEEVDNVGAYVAEYLGQAGKGQGRDVDDDRLRGQKTHFSSRGLLKPEEFTDKKIVEQVVSALPFEKMTYSAEFYNEQLGNITYKQYNLKK